MRGLRQAARPLTMKSGTGQRRMSSKSVWREEQASEKSVLARLDHHEIRLGEPRLAQNRFMGGVAGLHAGLDDDFFAP